MCIRDRYRNTKPPIKNTADKTPTDIKPEEITQRASMRSLSVRAFTKKFLIPLPIPKSKFIIQIKTERIVNHSPNTSLLLKYRIKAGVMAKDTKIPKPLKTIATTAFFAIMRSLVFSLLFMLLNFIIKQKRKFFSEFFI